jgi:hypothetical protein
MRAAMEARVVAWALGAVLALGLASGPFQARAADADDAERLRAENAALRAQVEALERELTTLRALADVPPDDDEPPLVATVPDDTTGEDGIGTRDIRLQRLRGSTAPHFFTLTRDASGTLTGRIETNLSGGIYEHTRHVRLTIDDEAHVYPVTSYDKQRVTTGLKRRIRRDHEHVAFVVPPAALAAMAAARRVEIGLGRSAFAVPPRGLVALRLLATTPAAE